MDEKLKPQAGERWHLKFRGDKHLELSTMWVSAITEHTVVLSLADPKEPLARGERCGPEERYALYDVIFVEKTNNG